MAVKNLTPERLRELLDYDPATGVFKWRYCGSCFARKGATAGTRHGPRYLRIGLDGSDYFCHRLAWLYVHGSWPQFTIDHIDGNGGNNAIRNLRDVPHAINMQNERKGRTNGKTGALGVHTTSRRNRYRAEITIHGRTIYLGESDSIEGASAIYLAAKRRIHKGGTL